MSWSRRIGRVCLAIGAPLLVIGVLELACRMLQLAQPVDVESGIANWARQWDGDFYRVFDTPGFNADGVHDRDHPIENPDGRTRIVFLGDSVTFGYGLPAHQSFPAIFEEKQRTAGVDVEVFNVALPGWSTRQARIAYDRIVRKYHPDLVVLGFCLNDVAEMQNNLSKPSAALAFAYLHSHLVRTLLPAAQWEIRAVRELFGAPDSESVLRGWEVTLEELSALASDVASDGARFAVVVFPFRFQLAEAAPHPIAQRVLLRFCVEQGISCIDVLPALRPLGPSAFVDESHLSHRGSQHVVDALIDAF